jgi:hypothetical protein
MSALGGKAGHHADVAQCPPTDEPRGVRRRAYWINQSRSPLFSCSRFRCIAFAHLRSKSWKRARSRGGNSSGGSSFRSSRPRCCIVNCQSEGVCILPAVRIDRRLIGFGSGPQAVNATRSYLRFSTCSTSLNNTRDSSRVRRTFSVSSSSSRRIRSRSHPCSRGPIIGRGRGSCSCNIGYTNAN